MTRVFISHSSRDRDSALRLSAALRDAGFDPWVDVEQLRAGDDWIQQIESAIESCEALVVALTPDALTSKWVRREALVAMELERPLLAALLVAVPRLPIYLIDRQYADFTRGWDVALGQLIAALRAPEAVAPADPAPDETTCFGYIAQLPAGERAAAVARELAAWAAAAGVAVDYGGFSIPVMHLRLALDDHTVTLCSVWAYAGGVQVVVPLQYWRVVPPFDRAAERRAVLRALNALLPDAEQLVPDRADGRPGLALIPALDGPDSSAEFQHILERAIARMRAGDE